MWLVYFVFLYTGRSSSRGTHLLYVIGIHSQFLFEESVLSYVYNEILSLKLNFHEPLKPFVWATKRITWQLLSNSSTTKVVTWSFLSLKRTVSAARENLASSLSCDLCFAFAIYVDRALRFCMCYELNTCPWFRSIRYRGFQNFKSQVSCLENRGIRRLSNGIKLSGVSVHWSRIKDVCRVRMVHLRM